MALCDSLSDEGGLRATAEVIAAPVMTRELDVRDRQGQMAFAAEVRDWAPAPIGLVVNNAGVITSQTVLDASPEDDQWCFDVNFWGVVHGTRAWLPVLHEQGEGTIANVSGVFGLLAFPTQSAYCAPKFAVRGFTESLRHELRGTSVRAVAIHPGGVATHIVDNARFPSTMRAGPITPRCPPTSSSSPGPRRRRRPRSSTGGWRVASSASSWAPTRRSSRC